MGRFSRVEREAALRHYAQVVEGCSGSGDWRPFADLFTADVIYTEHAYGVFRGREQVREWIVAVMAPFPHMRFPHAWIAHDDEHDAIVLGMRNVLAHPTEPGTVFEFPNVTRLIYGGEGLFSSEEDVYNPARDAAEAVGGWIAAGGQMLCQPSVPMKHA